MEPYGLYDIYDIYDMRSIFFLAFLLWLYCDVYRIYVMHLPIFSRVASLAQGQSHDCPSANEATMNPCVECFHPKEIGRNLVNLYMVTDSRCN